MTVNGDRFRLGPGDVLVNPRFGEHELVNDSGTDLRVLVFAVSTGEGSAPRSDEVGRASVGS